MVQYLIIPTPTIGTRLKYPTGKRDGNKLGKRKRTQRVYLVLVQGSNILVHPTEVEKTIENMTKIQPMFVDELTY